MSCSTLRAATPSTRATSSPTSFVASPGDRLIEQAHRVAHAARGLARDERDGGVVGCDLLLLEHVAQALRR